MTISVTLTSGTTATRPSTEPVVCIHGMLGSSFGYRKVLRELAARGLRGIAWDLPGFGLAERPPGHDYSWTSLGHFCIDAVNALNLDRFHLVVHDIGGPVGFELAAAHAQRIASLTILNTVVDVVGWTPPWTMRPFRWPVAGELWAASMAPPAFRFLMKLQGIGDVSQVSKAELNTYLALMKGNDRGRAFLKVSRSAQTTPEKQELYRQVVGSRSWRPNSPAAGASGGRESLPDITPPEAGRPCTRSRLTARLNRPGVLGGGERATATGAGRSCERGRQEARLGRGQHRGIFCVSCLNGRLMLRG